MRSSKRYTKLENWFPQMQSKLVEMVKEYLKKKSSQFMRMKTSYDVLNL